jgi:hypothetical protein
MFGDDDISVKKDPGELSEYQRQKIATRKFELLESKLSVDPSLLNSAKLKTAVNAETPIQREQRLQELYFPKTNSSSSYNLAITACALNKNWARVLVLISHMLPPSPLATTLIPTNSSFITAIRAATHTKDWAFCLYLFKQLAEYEDRLGKEWMEGYDDPTVVPEHDIDYQEFQDMPRANMYDLVCMAAFRCEEFQMCEDIFDRLQNENIEIFPSTYATVLRSLASNGKWSRIDEIITSFPEEALCEIESNALEECLKKLDDEIHQIDQQRYKEPTKVEEYEKQLKLFHANSMSISTHIYQHYVAAGIFSTLLFHPVAPANSKNFPTVRNSFMRHPSLRDLPHIVRLSLAVPSTQIDGSFGGVSHFSVLKNIAATIQLLMRCCKHSYIWSGGRHTPEVLVIPPHSSILPLKEETVLNAMQPPLYSVPKPFSSARINACFVELTDQGDEHTPMEVFKGQIEEEFLRTLHSDRDEDEHDPNSKSMNTKKLRNVPTFKQQEETIVKSKVFGQAHINLELFGSVVREGSVMDWINTSLTWCERRQMQEIKNN